MNSASDDHDNEAELSLDGNAMFEEPENFRPKTPPPTEHVVARTVAGAVPAELRVRLVGHHSLWAHCMWNAGVHLAHYFDEHCALVRGKTVLELGAAAALPSMVAALNGALRVVTTDYPEAMLISNMAHNVDVNVTDPSLREHIIVQGYLWGAQVAPLLTTLPADHKTFDVIVLADLIFNHNSHADMLRTCQQSLTRSKDAKVYVVYSHHRPWLAERDMAFFKLAAEEPFNFVVTPLFEVKMPPMFAEDPGDVDVRSTVHGHLLTWPEAALEPAQ